VPKENIGGEVKLFNKCSLENWERMDPYLTLHTRINSKCINNRNVQPGTIEI
jgi:hypothetical protein